MPEGKGHCGRTAVTAPVNILGSRYVFLPGDLEIGDPSLYGTGCRVEGKKIGLVATLVIVLRNGRSDRAICRYRTGKIRSRMAGIVGRTVGAQDLDGLHLVYVVYGCPGSNIYQKTVAGIKRYGNRDLFRFC